MELQLFDEVGEVLRGLVPADLGELHARHHRYGIKVWFDADKPTREHYEAQVIGAKHVPDATVLAIEVGFHAEHRDPAENERSPEGAAGPGEAMATDRSATTPSPVRSSTTATAGSVSRRRGPTPISATQSSPWTWPRGSPTTSAPWSRSAAPSADPPRRLAE